VLLGVGVVGSGWMAAAWLVAAACHVGMQRRWMFDTEQVMCVVGSA
jgi:hypothetical protein